MIIACFITKLSVVRTLKPALVCSKTNVYTVYNYYPRQIFGVKLLCSPYETREDTHTFPWLILMWTRLSGTYTALKLTSDSLVS